FFFLFFLYTPPAPPVTYTLSLHDALPIWRCRKLADVAANGSGGAVDRDAAVVAGAVDAGNGVGDRHYFGCVCGRVGFAAGDGGRSEEHTSELQSLAYLVCRLLLEKKKKYI